MIKLELTLEEKQDANYMNITSIINQLSKDLFMGERIYKYDIDALSLRINEYYELKKEEDEKKPPSVEIPIVEMPCL